VGHVSVWARTATRRRRSVTWSRVVSQARSGVPEGSNLAQEADRMYEELFAETRKQCLPMPFEMMAWVLEQEEPYLVEL
jgi:hypothetical protein